MASEQQTPRRARRPLLRVLGVIAVVVLALLALNAAAWALRSTERDSFDIDEPFDRVEVDVGAGRVTLEAAPDGSTVLTSQTETALFADADVSYEVVDGRLLVAGDCRRGIWLVGSFNCRTDVTLRLPADVEVVAKSSAGGVTARGLTGDADIESSAGSIRVHDHTGALRAHSSAGGVEVSGLRTDDAEITSSAGGVTVTAVTPPRQLLVSSSAGGVTVTLPGGEAYDLDASSSAGSTTVEVPTDPDSPYRVEVRSSAGGVTVRAG
jgi:Putative adhesin